MNSAQVWRAMKPRTAVLAIMATLMVLAADVATPANPAQAQQARIEQLQFCRDANGDRLRGNIDILLLLDDTLTLRTQDRNNLRFGIIRNFLEGVTQTESVQRVNFAAYTFGEVVTPILDFEAITAGDIDRIDQTIRANNPALQDKTDFIGALTRATQTLTARPAQNCRILLWFTDGNHDGSNRYESAVDRDESRELRRTFCEPNGIADRVRSQRINTFVLLLEPPPLQPLRLEASKDVFQVLTGDPLPNFPDEDRPGRTPTDDCDRPLGEQLGKVFAVSQAGELVAIIADFINELEDGGRITEQSCPYPDGALDSLALPDAQFVDWLSATDFSVGAQGPAPAASRLTVISAEGEEFAGEDVFVRYRESGPSARFRISSAYLNVLGPGWIVRTDEGRDLCLRSRPVDLTFRLSSGDPSLSVVAPAGLPERLWADGQLAIYSLDGRPLSTAEALRSPEVRGLLRVEASETLSRDGTLPAQIVIDGAPLRADGCSVIEIPGSLSTAGGGFFSSVSEAPQTPLVSSDCVITPATRGDEGGTLDFSAILASLIDLRGDERCEIGDDWHVRVDGQRITGTSQQLSAGGPPVRFEIASGVEPANAARDCVAFALPPVEFIWQDQAVFIPAFINAEWERRGDIGVASSFTAITLMVALLVSYLLLLFLNWLLLRPPLGQKLRSFSLDGRLVLTPRGDVRVEGLARVPDDLLKRLVNGEGGKWKPLSFPSDGYVLRRNLTLNPMKEPTLHMYAGGERVTSVSNPKVGSAIPIDFPSLAILWTKSSHPATPEREIHVVFTVVQSMTVSPSDDLKRYSATVQDLAVRLQRVLQATAPKDTAKPTTRESTSLSDNAPARKNRSLDDGPAKKKSMRSNPHIGTQIVPPKQGEDRGPRLNSSGLQDNSGGGSRQDSGQKKKRSLED